MSASAGGGGSIGSPRGKGKREPAADSAFEFCKVCNLNHNQARKHRYFPNHPKALSRFLSRFQDKLSELRFFLNNPSPRRPEHSALNRLWCVFCDAEIVELGSSFVCSNAIHHLASSDHLKQLKNFLWKYGGGMHHVPSFIISEADLIKWEKKCEESKTAHSISGGADVAGPMLSEELISRRGLCSITWSQLLVHLLAISWNKRKLWELNPLLIFVLHGSKKVRMLN